MCFKLKKIDDDKFFLSISGFRKFFFQMAPLKEFKKAIAPIQQNYHLKIPKTFFIFICNLRVSSLSFKITKKITQDFFLLFICNSRISSVSFKML